MTLLELCYNKPDLILLESTNSLSKAQLVHYSHLSPEKLRIRLYHLFKALVKSLEENSSAEIERFIKYVTTERFKSGYELSEVQSAINIMEECLWKTISEHLPSEDQVAALKQVLFMITNAKESLLTEYVSLRRGESFKNDVRA